MKIYQLYYIDGNDDTRKRIETTGTLRECVDSFKGWLEDHLTSQEPYEQEETKEQTKEFIETPEQWLNNTSDNEIYFDWYIQEIYTTTDEIYLSEL